LIANTTASPLISVSTAAVLDPITTTAAPCLEHRTRTVDFACLGSSEAVAVVRRSSSICTRWEVGYKDSATASSDFHGVASMCVSAASPFEDDSAALEMFGEAIPNLELVPSNAFVCIHDFFGIVCIFLFIHSGDFTQIYFISMLSILMLKESSHSYL
jgi:hypothetical protein